jgi:methylmalonyl-CoA mutase cobalamin-binding subunit
VTADPGRPESRPGERVPGQAEPAVAVVCCADDAGSDDVTAAVAALRAAGVSRVILAVPPDTGPVAEADDIITDGMDVLAFQRRTLDALGGPA